MTTRSLQGGIQLLPTSTFHNLSDEKKSRLFDAALQEFSIRTFSQASINQIVRNAGISKGSFYQYFKDKEDLYLYVLGMVARGKVGLLSRIRETNPQADVFEVILRSTSAFLEQGEASPGVLEMGMLMQLDTSEFIMKLRASSTQPFVELIERDKERGLIKPEVDAELLVQMLSTFSVNEYVRNIRDKERYLNNLSGAIQMIKAGVAVTIAD